MSILKPRQSPSGPLLPVAENTIVQADWRQVEVASILTPIAAWRIVQDAPLGDPAGGGGPLLIARIDGVTPGNIIEVSWDLSLGWAGVAPAEFNAIFRAVVSTVETPAWGTDYFELRNSNGAIYLSTDVAAVGIPPGPFVLSAGRRCAFVQPAGATFVRAGVAYNVFAGGPNDGILVGQSTIDPPAEGAGTGVTVRVTEYAASKVPRAPQGQLVPIASWSW